MPKLARTPPKQTPTRTDDAEKDRQKTKKHNYELLERKIDKLNAKLDKTISSAVNPSIGNEISKISASISEVNTNMLKLSADNANLTKSIQNMTLRFTEMEASVNFSNQRQDAFEERLKSMEERAVTTCDVSNLVHELEHKISAMEQQARQCNLEIQNLPEKRNENLMAILEQLGSVVKHQIAAGEVVSIHRVPHADAKTKRPKNVVVKFTTKHVRDSVLAAVRATKGLNSNQLSIPGTPHDIYVNEHLTLKNKMMYRLCREEARKHNYKYVWVKNGVILVRQLDTSPVIAVRSPQDLSKIKT